MRKLLTCSLCVVAGVWVAACDRVPFPDETVIPGGGGDEGDPPAQVACKSEDPPASALRAEEMRRWNQAASARPDEDPWLNFQWAESTRFPHPTFKGGSTAAYVRFAEVLRLFSEGEGNVAFLRDNCLFDTRLKNVFDSGQVGIDTSWRELAEDVAQGKSLFASADAKDRAAARRFLQQMDAR